MVRFETSVTETNDCRWSKANTHSRLLLSIERLFCSVSVVSEAVDRDVCHWRIELSERSSRYGRSVSIRLNGDGSNFFLGHVSRWSAKRLECWSIAKLTKYSVVSNWINFCVPLFRYAMQLVFGIKLVLAWRYPNDWIIMAQIAQSLFNLDFI